MFFLCFVFYKMSDLHGKNELCQKDFLLKLMPILFIYKSAVSGEDSVHTTVYHKRLARWVAVRSIFLSWKYKL